MFRSRTTIEIGFDADIGTLDPVWSSTGFTWSDVSSYAIGGYDSVRGGDEFAGIEPGAGAITLDSRDGRFDPSNGSSPYAGQMLAGKPIRIREQINLLSLDLSLGNTVSGLTGTGGTTLSVSTAQARSVTSSIRATNGTGTAGFRTATGTNGISIFAGEPLTAAAYIKRTTATGRNATISLYFYDAGGAFLSSSAGSPVTTSTSWQQISVQATAPSTAAFAAIYIETASSAAADVHHVDDLLLVPNRTPAALTWYPGGPIDVFRGFIDSWLPVPAFPDDAITTVRFSGTFAILAGEPVGESLWATLVQRSAPSLWWRLSDDLKVGAVDASLNGNGGRYRSSSGSTPISFTEGLVVLDPDGAVNLDAVWQQYVEGPGFTWSSSDFTIGLWIQSYPAASACTLFDSSKLTVTINSSGQLSAAYLGLTATVTDVDIRDGSPHLLWITCTPGAVTASVDATWAASTSGINTAERLNRRFYVGRDQAGTAAQYATCTLDEFLVWEGVLLDPSWFFIAGRAGNLPPATALGRCTPADVAQFLIDTLGAPTATGATATPSGDSARSWANRIPMTSPLEMLNIAASSGQLNIYEAANGTPTVEAVSYVPSTHLAYLPTATFGPADLPYLGAPSVDFGEASVINTVVVSRPDQATLTFRSSSSRNARGSRSASLTVWTTSEKVAANIAAWILAQFSSEGRRLTSLTAFPSVDATQAALWAEIGDVITVNELTVDGRTITTTARIVGKDVAKIPNADGLGALSITMHLSPIRLQPMVLDTSTYGVLGSSVSPPTGKWGP